MSAEASHERLVRIAELEVDPAQLDAYKIALRQEIEASIRVEPGVLSLYAETGKACRQATGGRHIGLQI